MHGVHVSSGGRYPALRTLAILHLVAACAILVVGVWRAVRVLTDSDPGGFDLFGATPDMGSRVLSAFSWLAVSFMGVLAMFAIAELIKLMIDIERNTRVAGTRAAAVEIAAPDGATATVVTGSSDGVGVGVGEGIPGGGRIGKLLDGEETAEGALIRGH
jgi:hypothetical protein